MDLIKEFEIPSEFDVPKESNLYNVFEKFHKKVDTFIAADNFKGLLKLFKFSAEMKEGLDEAEKDGTEHLAHPEFVEVENRYMICTLIRINSYMHFLRNNISVEQMGDIKTQYKKDMDFKLKDNINEEMQTEHSYIYYEQSDLDNYLSSVTVTSNLTSVKQHVNLFRDYLLANGLCEVQE